MSRRGVRIDLQDAALAAGATAVEVVHGGRHGQVLLVSLPSGTTIRYPIADRTARGRGANRENSVAGIKRAIKRRLAASGN